MNNWIKNIFSNNQNLSRNFVKNGAKKNKNLWLLIITLLISTWSYPNSCAQFEGLLTGIMMVICKCGLWSHLLSQIEATPCSILQRSYVPRTIRHSRIGLENIVIIRYHLQQLQRQWQQFQWRCIDAKMHYSICVGRWIKTVGTAAGNELTSKQGQYLRCCEHTSG